MLLVFAHQDSPRLRYVLSEIVGRRLGLAWELTRDLKAFEASSVRSKLAYSLEPVSGSVWISPGELLSAGATVEPVFRSLNGMTVLFPGPGDLGFDPLSMAFWSLSRMEEYGAVSRDSYGRFAAASSLFYRSGCLEEPVLDASLALLYEVLGLTAPAAFTIQPSIDIDIAYQFKGRGVGRAAGAAIKQLQFTKRRIKALLGGPDAHDPQTTVLPTLKEHPNTRVFLLANKRPNAFNKQVRRQFKPFQQSVKDMAQTGLLGLHPSVQKRRAESRWAEEKAWIEQTGARELTHSRQHYIHLSFPNTYRNLIQLGIQHDYSMGYPDTPGFRAGTAYPFAWYDLEKEEATELILHPFCLMDVTCKGYQKLSAEGSIELGELLKSRVRATGGEFGFIFHNESLSDSGPWKGWRRVFESWTNDG